jgi:polysaccharide biosynthesis protein PslH
MKDRLKILFLSRWYPYPIDNGSKIRIFNLIEHLSQRHQVDLISFTHEPVEREAEEVMMGFCTQVRHIPYRPFRPDRLKAVLGFFSPQPRSVRDTYNTSMEEVVSQALQQQSYDVVVASQVDMAPYALLAGPGVVKILEEIELTTLYEQQLFSKRTPEKARRWFMWRKWTHYLSRLLLSFDATTVVSEPEKARIEVVAPKLLPVQVIPNGVSISAMSGDFGEPRPGSLVFSGSLTYGPNMEAMQYFLDQIYPLVQRDHPAVRLSITGKQDLNLVARLPQREGVTFTGYLDDVRPAVAQSWASVVPLRTGGGTRLKALEAMALGTPVVSTPKGIEGLELAPQWDYLLGEDPAGFAEVLLMLLEDPALRGQLSARGRKTVTERYDWAKIGPCFCDFIETITVKKRETVYGSTDKRSKSQS